MPVLGIVAQDLFLFHFQGLLISTEQAIRPAVLGFNLVLIITILPRFVQINITDK